MLRRLAILLGVLVGVFLVMQLVPYGRDHTNPPVVQEPDWDSPETRALAQRSCFDCHSNETVWPWYASVAPSSWLVSHDVEEGRGHLNFSEWQRPQRHADDAAEMVAEGEMPPAQYTLMHSNAQLTDVERAALVQGLRATLGSEDGAGESDEQGDDD